MSRQQTTGAAWRAAANRFRPAPPLEGLRDYQKPPTDPHTTGHVLVAGRGAGKSYAAAKYLGWLAQNTAKLRARIIAPTLGDAVATALDPQSGIVAQYPDARFTGGTRGTRVVFPNGSQIFLVGTPTARDVDRLRALTSIDVDHFEEAAANPQLGEAFKQAALSRRGTRLRKPRWLATTTPRTVPLVREWLKDTSGKIYVSRATTFDNPDLPEEYLDYAESLKGTRLYRQEVLGELIDQVEGALWSLTDIERSTVWMSETDWEKLVAGLSKIVVGVDPASGEGTTGIVVVGRDTDGVLWVLEDRSMVNASPLGWAQMVVNTAIEYGATIVAEKNQGGKMVASNIRTAAQQMKVRVPPLTTVWASEGKKTRAEPVSQLWEAEFQTGRMAPRRRGGLDQLVAELTEWVPGESDSPDRLDGMTWASQSLLDRGPVRMRTPGRRPSGGAGLESSADAFSRIRKGRV